MCQKALFKKKKKKKKEKKKGGLMGFFGFSGIFLSQVTSPPPLGVVPDRNRRGLEIFSPPSKI